MPPLSAPLDAWLHPTVQAAVVAGLVALAGWLITGWQNRGRDRRLRDERVIDTQRALLAEIRSNHAASDIEAMQGAAEAGLAAIAQGSRPVLPEAAPDRIFAAMLADIPILPSSVIDDVVLYYRQLGEIARLAAAYRDLPLPNAHAPEAEHAAANARAAAVYADYVELQMIAPIMAGRAMEMLVASLEGGESAVQQMRDEQRDARSHELRATLPGELAALRHGLDRSLNTKSSARCDP